jgi:hypothetical protein
MKQISTIQFQWLDQECAENSLRFQKEVPSANLDTVFIRRRTSVESPSSCRPMVRAHCNTHCKLEIDADVALAIGDPISDDFVAADDVIQHYTRQRRLTTLSCSSVSALQIKLAQKTCASPSDTSQSAASVSDDIAAALSATNMADMCDPPCVVEEIKACPSQIEQGTGPTNDAVGELCFVCMETEADAVLIDCGHGGLCAGEADSTLRASYSFRLMRHPPSHLTTAVRLRFMHCFLFHLTRSNSADSLAGCAGHIGGPCPLCRRDVARIVRVVWRHGNLVRDNRLRVSPALPRGVSHSHSQSCTHTRAAFITLHFISESHNSFVRQ